MFWRGVASRDHVIITRWRRQCVLLFAVCYASLLCKFIYVLYCIFVVTLITLTLCYAPNGWKLFNANQVSII